MSARTLMDQRNTLIVREKEMLVDFEKEPTDEKRANLDKINKDIEGLTLDYERVLKAEGRAEGSYINPRAPRNDPSDDRPETRAKAHAEKHNAEFRAWLAKAVRTESGGAGVFDFKGREFRAGLEATADTLGGYTVPAEQFNAELIRAVNDEMIVSRIARNFTVTNADSLGTPSLDSRATVADWGSELSVGNTDTGLKFGKRTLTPAPITAAAIVSKKLLRASAVPIDQIVREELAYAAAIPIEQAFLNGNGANRPLGCFTVSANGVSTSRDVTTAASSVVISSYQELVDTKYGVKPQYWGRASWLMSVTQHGNIRKILDGNGNPVWMPAGLGTVLSAPAPDRLLDSPVYVSQYAPVSTAYGSSVNSSGITGDNSTALLNGRIALYGDFSKYWTATALDLQIEHLVEIKALTAQDIFLLRAEVDGMPVLAEAFAPLRLKGF